MPAKKIRVVDVISAIEDQPEDNVPLVVSPDVKAIETEPNESQIDPEVVVIPTHGQGLKPEPIQAHEATNSKEQEQAVENPVSSVKTVELVECPDCKKKMTKKTLKYSHANNCIAKKEKGPEPSMTPVEEEEEEEEEEEVKPSPPPPKIKRTVSVAPAVKKVIKKSLNKVEKAEEQINRVKPQIKQTVANIYGRENRNERAIQKTEKMVKLFVNASNLNK